MSGPLNVLMVEDEEDHAEIVLRLLRRGGYQPNSIRVENAEDMRAALERERWQVILSDYHMPRFSALDAFKILKQSGQDIPFIIVSGTVGEEVAVEAMRSGVHDYILKGALTRLVPAVERELREAAVRAERRKIQEELLISDRMVSIGTLAAGVGHEINNPLAALLANLDVALEDLTALTDDVRKKAGQPIERLGERMDEINSPLRDAREAGDRVRLIVRDLRLFSRTGDEEKRDPVDLQSVLESALRMARNEIRHRARLVKDFAAVPPVLANESRLCQVFLNLLINAAQAIPEGHSDENEIRVSTALAGGLVIAEVHDSGGGVPPDVLPRIFEPFFTTKPVGVGTGLGLAICRRIITGLNGTITVESTPGAGTTFRVTLPVSTAASAADELPAAWVPRQTRRGRVLVVDDEPMIGTAVRRILSPHHDVVAARTGREALGALDQGNAFDVILCDVMMPEMTGTDLHAALLARDPELSRRLVFMTAGAFTAHSREFLSTVANQQIEKPFDERRLKTLVADFVDAG